MNWNKEGKSLFILILGAAAFRTVYYQWYVEYVPHALEPINDAQMYWQWGLNLYRQGWLYPHNEAYYQAPLYPMFIALVHQMGYHTVQSVLFFQLLIGVVNTLLCYFIARSFLPANYAMLAATAFSICPLVFFFETKLTATTLGLFLWLSFVLAIVHWILKPSWYLLVTLSFLFGISVICRPNLLFTFPFLCLCVLKLDIRNITNTQLLFSQLRYGSCAVFALIVIALIGCVTLKNYTTRGEWVLITGNSGVTLYMGNNPNASGGLARIEGLSNDIEDQVYGGVKLASQLAGEELTLNESSKFWVNKTIEYIVQNPFQWFMLIGKKLLWSVNYHPPSVNYSYLFESEWILLEKFFMLITSAVLILGIISLIMNFKSDNELYYLFLMMVLGYITLSMVYYSSGRFLTTVIPIMAILGTKYLQQCMDCYRNNTLNRSKIILTVWITAFFVLNPFLMKYQDQEIATGWYNYGVLLDEKNKSEKFTASECYLKAIEHYPNHTSAMLNLGVVLSKQGELLKANTWFEKVLTLDPQNKNALQNMIINYQRLNMLDQIEVIQQKYPMN